MALLTFCAPLLLAQSSDHIEAGAFFNYTRLRAFGNTNFYGIGGRLGVRYGPHVVIEGEMAYDPEQNNDNNFTTNGVTITNSNLHILHGLFGPKVRIGSHGVYVFGTVKGGFMHTSTAVSLSTQLSQFGDSSTFGVLYPGGGVEIFKGPFGVRAEVGDEIYYQNGPHDNWRATFGPVIRF